jgi:hypothetical protein
MPVRVKNIVGKSKNGKKELAFCEKLGIMRYTCDR